MRNSQVLPKTLISLERSLLKYGERLSKVQLGRALYVYAPINKLEQIYGVKLEPNTELGAEFYSMVFKDEEERVRFVPHNKAPSTESFVGKKVKIVEPNSRKLKKELREYVNKEGSCILALKDEQLVVEFPVGDGMTCALSFSKENVELVRSFEAVHRTFLEISKDGKTYEESPNFMITTTEEIEAFLVKNPAIDSVAVKTVYFLVDKEYLK